MYFSDFKDGFIQFDNIPPTATKNVTWKAPLPDGTYNTNVRQEFCCRDDGSIDTPISLPTAMAFALYKAKYEGCQKVKGDV